MKDLRSFLTSLPLFLTILSDKKIFEGLKIQEITGGWCRKVNTRLNAHMSPNFGLVLTLALIEILTVWKWTPPPNARGGVQHSIVYEDFLFN